MSRRNLNGYVSTNWGGGNVIEMDNYLTMVALEDGFAAQLSVNECEYCVDGDGNWKALPAATNTEAINTGQTLSFRGNLTPSSSNGIGTFTFSKSCNLEGNCMSMLFGDAVTANKSLSGKNYAFYKLFYNCTTIKSVSSGFLPATTLANNCYYYMFYGCTNLITTPALPATTLVNWCYSHMFKNCTSLTQAPELPATNLAEYCYYNMFNGCTSLTIATELPATTLVKMCYYYMFYNTNVLPDCSNINFSSTSILSSGGLRGLFAGTKVTDSDLERILPKNSNGKYCLPVTTLASDCYACMFSNCKSLTQAPVLPATTLAKKCYYCMFEGCTSLTQSPVLPAATLADYCYQNMFRYCKSLTQAPVLPATSLAEGCYRNMFQGCSKLNYIKAMFTTTPSTSYTNSWVSGVASKGQFVKNFQATWNVTGVNGVPSGWTITTA